MSIAREWFKSSYSGSEGGNCLEVAYDRPASGHHTGPRDAAVHIRDSKNPTGPTLTLTTATWAAFTEHLAH